MKPCIINPDLPATCNDCHLLANGCDGTDEPVQCNICGITIISATQLIIHKNNNHKL